MCGHHQSPAEATAFTPLLFSCRMHALVYKDDHINNTKTADFHFEQPNRVHETSLVLTEFHVYDNKASTQTKQRKQTYAFSIFFFCYTYVHMYVYFRNLHCTNKFRLQ